MPPRLPSVEKFAVRMHVLPNIPAKNFWSVVVYDALSRSELQNGQPLRSVSSYVNPKINADGSVDIVFGPSLRTATPS